MNQVPDRRTRELVALYRRIEHANPDELDDVIEQYVDRCRDDPEAVARAVQAGALD